MTIEELIELQTKAQPNMAPQWLKDMKINYSDSNHYEFLYVLAQAVQPSVVVEIGTHMGLSALALKRGCTKAQVYTIDKMQGAGELVRDEPGITVITGWSKNRANAVPDAIDILYIDGGHDYNDVAQDWHDYAPKVKDGGLILIDDIKFYEGPAMFWERIKGDKIILDEIHGKYGFGVVIK